VTSPPKAQVSLREVPRNELRTVADFSVIGDRAERSRALFVEAARVFTHPRCINCHPSGDTPHQGMEMVLHDPPVVRGPKDSGVPGMECATCHQDRNQELTRVPGAPKWQLAPIELAWVGQSVAHICNVMKDPERNGHKTLAQIVEHNAHDQLVAWGWHPGADREPAPGTQEQLGALIAAWVDTGAECPAEESK
jgi:mono/diheme cytochrome c family protein